MLRECRRANSIRIFVLTSDYLEIKAPSLVLYGYKPQLFWSLREAQGWHGVSFGSESAISMFLAGDRKLTVEQIRKLSTRFKLPADVFIAASWR